MYLFDSSVIIEILKGNEVLVEKFKNIPLVTIDLAYGEVYYYFLRTGLNTQQVKNLNFEFLPYSRENIELAMEILLERKKSVKDFSFVDSMVYTIGTKNHLIVLTRDFGFKGLPNVDILP